MTRRQLGLFGFAVALALLLALRLRNGFAPSSTPETPAVPEKKTSAIGTTESTSPDLASPKPAPAKLTGLRLLTKDEASQRGWVEKPLPEDGPSAAARETLKSWQAKELSFKYDDVPLADVIAELKDRFGLEAQIDPKASLEGRTVTFVVTGLAADQAIDLILKMASLGWAIDAQGLVWITTPDRVATIRGWQPKPMTVEMDQTMHIVRGRVHEPPVVTREDLMADWMKGRKVTASIVREPVESAATSLAKQSGLALYEWSDAAKEAAAKAPHVSLIGENLPLSESIEGVLKSAGLVLKASGGGLGSVVTIEEHRQYLKEEDEKLGALGIYRRNLAALRARPVRIEGACLSLSAVAAQITAQTGEAFVFTPGVEECQAMWESGGLEQTVAEILDTVSRDAELSWDFTAPWNPKAPNTGTASIWLVGKR